MLKVEYNCLVMGHLNGLKYFENPRLHWEKFYNKKEKNIYKPTKEDKEYFFNEVKEGVFPDILFSNNEVINIDNNHYKIIHTPGHSGCSICIYNMDSEYLYSGDLLSGKGVGNNAISIEYSYYEYINSINLIKKLKIKKIFPAHFHIKQEGDVITFLDESLTELLEYKKIIIDLIKNSKNITLVDLVNKFANITGRNKTIFLEDSVKKIILSLMNNNIVSKEKKFIIFNK